jgi:hypothetical protein
MAIYSLNHRTIGRTTHAPRTAGYHIRYITRPQAATAILGARMPLEPDKARAWMDAEESRDRINARVADKLMVALPIELTPQQRVELVTGFAEAVSQGRTPWIAAIHDGPADSDNPHAHIMFRDRDIQTGRRVMQLSEKGSTSRLRVAWQEHANRALEAAGVAARIDHRSLEQQGIDREAGLHVGQAGQLYEGLETYEWTRHAENEKRLSRNKVRAPGIPEAQPEWTHRAGMVAQQRSAAEWVKAAREKRRIAERKSRLTAFLKNRKTEIEVDGPDFDI